MILECIESKSHLLVNGQRYIAQEENKLQFIPVLKDRIYLFKEHYEEFYLSIFGKFKEITEEQLRLEKIDSITVECTQNGNEYFTIGNRYLVNDEKIISNNGEKMKCVNVFWNKHIYVSETSTFIKIPKKQIRTEKIEMILSDN